MTVIEYTMKIKETSEALGSINVMLDEEEMVQVCLGGLLQRYGPIRTEICTREKPPTFFDLQSMLMVEENHIGVSRGMHSDGQILYMEADRPLVVEDAVDRHAMEAVDKSRTKGTEKVSIVVDPPRAREVKVVPKADKAKPPIAGIVAQKVTSRASNG